MLGEEDEDGRNGEELCDSVLGDVIQHLDEIEAGHDVYGDPLMREAADEVALREGVIHGQKTECGGAASLCFIVGGQLVELHNANAIGDVIAVGDFDTLGETGLKQVNNLSASKEEASESYSRTVPEL
jgi:hypothetical protein